MISENRKAPDTKTRVRGELFKSAVPPVSVSGHPKTLCASNKAGRVTPPHVLS